MTLLTPAKSERPGVPSFPVSRFTVGQYHRMIERGAFVDGPDVELIDGYLSQKMSRNPPHDFIVTRMQHVLSPRIVAPWIVRGQCAVTIGNSEPEPDFAIVVGPEERYVRRHPGPADIGLAIEVANTTLALDREAKGPAFAGAGVPHYWILNVAQPQVEVYGDPANPDDADPEYRSRRVYRIGESVPLVLGGQQIDLIPVGEIFPPYFLSI